MPQITFSDESRADLNRIRNFMNEVAPHKTAEAIITIIDGIDQLAIHPLIGKAHPVDSVPHLRELFISYGKAGYIVFYTLEETIDTIEIHGIRHSKELETPFISRLR